MFFTADGLIKKTSLSQFESIRTNGKIAINLKEGDILLNVKRIHGNEIVGIAASNGKVCSFYSDEARPMGRDTSGVKGIELEEGDKAIGVTTATEGHYILAITDKGYGKLSDAETYRKTKRGSKGVLSIKATDKTGGMIAHKIVDDDKSLLIVTEQGMIIRISVDSISQLNRVTQGVRLINLKEDQFVSTVSIINKDDNEETEETVEEIQGEAE